MIATHPWEEYTRMLAAIVGGITLIFCSGVILASAYHLSWVPICTGAMRYIILHSSKLDKTITQENKKLFRMLKKLK